MLPAIYNMCSMWISPSTNEGFGLTTLEAMGCGIPVIWVPSFGLEEYLTHRKNCMVARNKSEIVASINALLSNTDLFSTIAENGRRTAKQFVWDRSANMFKRALEDILK